MKNLKKFQQFINESQMTKRYNQEYSISNVSVGDAIIYNGGKQYIIKKDEGAIWISKDKDAEKGTMLNQSQFNERVAIS